MLLKHPSGAGRTLHLHHRPRYTGAQLAALANLSATGSIASAVAAYRYALHTYPRTATTPQRMGPAAAVALTYRSERLGHWCSGSPLYSLLTGLAYLPG